MVKNKTISYIKHKIVLAYYRLSAVITKKYCKSCRFSAFDKAGLFKRQELPEAVSPQCSRSYMIRSSALIPSSSSLVAGTKGTSVCFISNGLKCG